MFPAVLDPVLVAVGTVDNIKRNVLYCSYSRKLLRVKKFANFCEFPIRNKGWALLHKFADKTFMHGRWQYYEIRERFYTRKFPAIYIR